MYHGYILTFWQRLTTDCQIGRFRRCQGRSQNFPVALPAEPFVARTSHSNTFLQQCSQPQSDFGENYTCVAHAKLTDDDDHDDDDDGDDDDNDDDDGDDGDDNDDWITCPVIIHYIMNFMGNIL